MASKKKGNAPKNEAEELLRLKEMERLRIEKENELKAEAVSFLTVIVRVTVVGYRFLPHIFFKLFCTHFLPIGTYPISIFLPKKNEYYTNFATSWYVSYK